MKSGQLCKMERANPGVPTRRLEDGTTDGGMIPIDIDDSVIFEKYFIVPMITGFTVI